jgi:hypothetical protein
MAGEVDGGGGSGRGDGGAAVAAAGQVVWARWRRAGPNEGLARYMQ